MGWKKSEGAYTFLIGKYIKESYCNSMKIEKTIRENEETWKYDDL